MKELLFSPRGRINRSRFWLAALGTTLTLFAVLAVVLVILWQVMPGTVDADGGFKVDGVTALPYFAAFLAYLVVAVWSGVCLGIKRYHDLNKSGAWLLVMFVPFVGTIIYFVQAGCLRGTIGVNSYGADPLAA